MGTVSIANALAFAPNLQKGLESAAKIFKLLNRVPAITDSSTARSGEWVNLLINNKINLLKNNIYDFINM